MNVLLLHDVTATTVTTPLPLILASPAKPYEKQPFKGEYAGRAFERLIRRLRGLADHVTTTTTPTPSRPNTAQDSSLAEDGSDDIDTDNYYDILGLGEDGTAASAQQIKRAYQQLILKVHPDKAVAAGATGTPEELNARFRLVQKAYDTLSDPARRRGYDSQFDFDDWIPTGFEQIKSFSEFSELYASVFKSNARFSEVKPVPMLGEEIATEKDVRAFYTFWRTFRSWRDFSVHDEYKIAELETADGRDERRWMMKENERNREKRKVKEHDRVQKLVERAYNADPRIAKFKVEAEKLKAEKMAAQAEVERQAQEAELVRMQEAERARDEAARVAEAEKQERERNKNERKKLIKAFKDALASVNASELWVQHSELVPKASNEMLVEMTTKIFKSSSSDVAKQWFHHEQTLVDEAAETLRKQQEAAAEERKREEQARKHEKNEKKWTREALSSLAKAVAKFPGGTRNRWECVANYMITTGQFSCTAEECIGASKLVAVVGSGAMAKPVWERPTNSAVDAVVSNDAPPAGPPPPASGVEEPIWTIEDIKLLEAAILKYPSTMEKNERWSAIAAHVGKPKKECAAKFKQLREKALGKTA